MKQEINIVWLKRDLRTQDHLPLYNAVVSDLPFIAIYLFEPEMIAYPDCDLRHLQFQYHSFTEFAQKLEAFGLQAMACFADATKVFEFLLNNFKITEVFSYQESGIQRTWERDKAVRKMLSTNGALWKEFPRDGIERGIKNREGWDKRWYQKMHQKQVEIDFNIGESVAMNNPFPIPKVQKEMWEDYPVAYQTAGKSEAWKLLNSFCEERGKNYAYHISKPHLSKYSCGRISAHLAWGCVSVKQVYQFVKNHPNYSINKRSFSAFLMRLKWRCHFIQKFESECEYETQCVNRGFELLENTNDPQIG